MAFSICYITVFLILYLLPFFNNLDAKYRLMIIYTFPVIYLVAFLVIIKVLKVDLSEFLYLFNLKYFLKKKDYAIILAYHRIADLKKDTRLLAVTPQKFEEQIIYLKSIFNIISLQELVRDLKNKKIKKKSLVITFDDGYADNLFKSFIA